MTTVLFTLAALAAASTIPAHLARSKGRRFRTWYAYAFCMWFLAMAHALLVKRPAVSDGPGSAAGWLRAYTEQQI